MPSVHQESIPNGNLMGAKQGSIPNSNFNVTSQDIGGETIATNYVTERDRYSTTLYTKASQKILSNQAPEMKYLVD